MSDAGPRLFPDDATLERELAALLRRAAPPRAGLRVVERTPNQSNSFPRETVRCAFDDGSTLLLHCKYDSTPERHYDGDVRFGVEYEAAVYERFLAEAPVSVPAFFGTFAQRSGPICLVLERLVDAMHMSWIEGGTAKAAVWLGRFHAVLRQRLGPTPPSPLRAMEPDHFQQLSRKARDGAATWLPGSPWIAALAEQAWRPLAPLLTTDSTLIHGEFFPSNVLLRDDRVYPIDWETAAWASGALDLAALTEGWESAVIDVCERSYRVARWGGETPPEFDAALDAARIYWQLRYLGTCDRPGVAHVIERELERLRPAALRLGVG